jgi:hypothetical protein
MLRHITSFILKKRAFRQNYFLNNSLIKLVCSLGETNFCHIFKVCCVVLQDDIYGEACRILISGYNMVRMNSFLG